jgi:hypothetical protein
VWASDGGVLRRDDGLLVSVPPGALAADAILSAAPGSSDGSRKAARRAEQALGAAGEEVEFGPDGLSFNAPVTLTLPYDPARAAAVGVDEKKLLVYWWDASAGAWTPMPSQVDRAARVVTAQTTHFSGYQVMGGGASVTASADGAFAFHDIYAFPSPAKHGRPVTLRMQPGLADSVEFKVFDLTGRPVRSGTVYASQIVDDGNGKGPQYSFDFVWDTVGSGSGVYPFSATARKSGLPPITRNGKVGVIK